jgi:hypothetical protein
MQVTLVPLVECQYLATIIDLIYTQHHIQIDLENLRDQKGCLVLHSQQEEADSFLRNINQGL